MKTFLPMLLRQRRVTHVHGLICFFSFETCLTAWKTCLDLYLILGRSLYSEKKSF